MESSIKLSVIVHNSIPRLSGSLATALLYLTLLTSETQSRTSTMAGNLTLGGLQVCTEDPGTTNITVVELHHCSHLSALAQMGAMLHRWTMQCDTVHRIMYMMLVISCGTSLKFTAP